MADTNLPGPVIGVKVVVCEERGRAVIQISDDTKLAVLVANKLDHRFQIQKDLKDYQK